MLNNSTYRNVVYCERRYEAPLFVTMQATIEMRSFARLYFIPNKTPPYDTTKAKMSGFFDLFVAWTVEPNNLVGSVVSHSIRRNGL